MKRALWVSLGGVLGANVRYWLGEWLRPRFAPGFPWTTLLVNTSGSFLLGLLSGLLAARLPQAHAEPLRLLVGVGFLGAYTTFSAFSGEILGLIETGAWPRAILYAAASVVLGLGFAALGMRLGRL